MKEENIDRDFRKYFVKKMRKKWKGKTLGQISRR